MTTELNDKRGIDTGTGTGTGIDTGIDSGIDIGTDIEREIELVQKEIIKLSKPMVSTKPLPPLPIGSNLARGPDEMWHVYMYRLSEYNTLNSLGTIKENNVHPYLELPLTTIAPLDWSQKVEKAKIIAQYLLADTMPSRSHDDTAVLIKDLQKRLMCLEEQYLDLK